MGRIEYGRWRVLDLWHMRMSVVEDKGWLGCLLGRLDFRFVYRENKKGVAAPRGSTCRARVS